MKLLDLLEILKDINFDSDVTVSVDISTSENDSTKRVFTDEFLGINDKESSDIVLLFSGSVNE